MRNIKFTDLKADDVVTRVLGGTAEMKLKITDVKDGLICCGSWTFSQETGLEIDEDLGWTKDKSGSRLVIK